MDVINQYGYLNLANTGFSISEDLWKLIEIIKYFLEVFTEQL